MSPTKPLANQRDLSLAYSPGVAYACLAIERDPKLAAEYTSRSNLVGVVTNGTAVLGLGDIGPLAGKPVMEGKGCLFKKFAGIDVFDLEIAEKDPDRLVEVIAALEPTLGGINLEDIKAPECFEVERKLKARLKIPVFHDDQHGTAIISAAAILNSLELTGRDIATMKIACSGAGAAAIACLDLIVALGADPRNIVAVDTKGVVHAGRDEPRRVEAALRARDRQAHARRRGARRRRVPRLLGRRRAHAGDGRHDGRAADHPRARQPGAGDPARAREGGAARLHRRHRPLRLPEPGQQRPLLPLHLPRRARRRRDRRSPRR